MFYHQQPLTRRQQKGLFTFYKQQEELQAKLFIEKQSNKKKSEKKRKSKLIKTRKMSLEINQEQKKSNGDKEKQTLLSNNYNQKQLTKKYYIPIMKAEQNERKQQRAYSVNKLQKCANSKLMDSHQLLAIRELKLQNTQDIQKMRKNIEKRYLSEKIKKDKKWTCKIKSFHLKQNKNCQFQKFQINNFALSMTNLSVLRVNLQNVSKIKTLDFRQYSEELKNQIYQKINKQSSIEDLQKNQTKRFLKSLNQSRLNQDQKRSQSINNFKSYAGFYKNETGHFYCKTFDSIQRAKKLPQELSQNPDNYTLGGINKLQIIKSKVDQHKFNKKFEQFRKKKSFNLLKKKKNNLNLGLSLQSQSLDKNKSFQYNNISTNIKNQGSSLKERTEKFRQKILSNSIYT